MNRTQKAIFNGGGCYWHKQVDIEREEQIHDNGEERKETLPIVQVRRKETKRM